MRLETISQAAYHKRREEIQFYEACFQCVAIWIEIDHKLIPEAERLACKYGLHAIDALHVAAVRQAGAQEFISTTKPLYRVTELGVLRLDSLN